MTKINHRAFYIFPQTSLGLYKSVHSIKFNQRILLDIAHTLSHKKNFFEKNLFWLEATWKM